MFKDILFLIKKTNTGFGKLIAGEFIQGLLLAIPSGILLLVIWELFSDSPDKIYLIKLIAVMVVVFVIQLLLAPKIMINTNNTIYSLTSKLRMLLGNHLQKLSLGYYKKRDSGDLASVILQDVSNFETIFSHSVQDIFGGIFGTLFLSIFLFSVDYKLALLMLSVIPVGIFFVWLAGKVADKFSRRQIHSRNASSSRFIEYIQGIRHLKAFNIAGNKYTTMRDTFDRLRKDSIKMEAVPGPFLMTSFVIFEFTFLFMVYVAIGRINGDTLSIPALVAFLVIGYKLFEPLKLIMIDYAMIKYMSTSLRRITDLLQAPLQDEGKQIVPKRYDVQFDCVTFSYIDREVLSDISFNVPEGKLTALVGASGSGKTTIVNLIARFWDVQKGDIRIGGVSVKNIKPEIVYGMISEVFQDVYLFDDTIMNNIKIGNPNATEKEIMQAAEKAQVCEFLDKLPNGINTMVGETGSKLSGGQKQRISIARAMLKDAPIILLDEATAALDPENEIYIQTAIQELVKDKTVIVIAHKLQTVKNADNIIVLDKGNISECGTHNELMKREGVYYDFWNMQQNTSGWQISRTKEKVCN